MQMEAGVKSLLAQAERAAQKRGQQASTAHLLLVMLQGQDDVSGLLRGVGIRETTCSTRSGSWTMKRSIP